MWFFHTLMHATSGINFWNITLHVRRPIQKSRYHMIPFILSREQTKLSLCETKIITTIASLGYSKGPLRRAKVEFLWVIMFCILIGIWVTSTIFILGKQLHASVGPYYGVPYKKFSRHHLFLVPMRPALPPG